MLDYRNMPLRKAIAFWSMIFAGILTVVLTLAWICKDADPPSGLVNIIIVLIGIPPSTYMGTSVYQSVRTQSQAPATTQGEQREDVAV